MDRGFSYSARSTHVGRRRLWLATIVVVVIFAADFISGGAVRAGVRTAVADLSLALRHAGANISASGLFSSKASLVAENQSLKAQIQTLQEQAALSTALEAQVEALAGAAHLASSNAGITAPVASSFIASPYGTFLIGAGSSDGVTVGSLVLSDDADDANDTAAAGVVVGTVSQVSAHVSTVVELFAPDHTQDALLDGAAISVKGSGGGNAVAQVPNGVTVRPGDAVTAPAFDNRVIGIVGHVDADPSDAAMTVSIGSPVNLASMQYVFVVPAAQ